MEQFLHFILHHHPIWLQVRVCRQWSLWVIQHTGTKTHTVLISLQNIVVTATLTALPELLVVCKLREGHRLVTQTGIELHHRQRSGYTENLGIRKLKSRKLKSPRLNLRRKTQVAILRIYNKSRCGNIVTMSPTLNITKAN